MSKVSGANATAAKATTTGAYQRVRDRGLAFPVLMAEEVFQRTTNWGGHCGDDGLFWTAAGVRSLGTFGAYDRGFFRQISRSHQLNHASRHRLCRFHEAANPGQGDEAYSAHLINVMKQHQQSLCEAPLQRPDDHHPAEVLYLDGTGVFNPAAFRQKVGRELAPQYLPPGFVLTQAALGSDNTLTETQQVLEIAHGDHGYAGDEPFIVVGLAHPNRAHATSSPRHMEELLAGCQGLARKRGHELLTQLFVAPHF